MNALTNTHQGQDELDECWKRPAREVMAMSDEDYRKAYTSLEADNMHPECVILQAKRTGRKDFVVEAQGLFTEQRRAGYLTPSLQNRRWALCHAMKTATLKRVH